jgi:O-antigen/teichoic acid export membrane protein
MGTRILTLWVGPVYANASVHIMDVLVIATAIRMLGGPYTSALIGAGEHVRVIFSPIFEGVSNLLVSVIAGYYLGPIGVAIGTLAGAVGGISLHACYNMPRIHDIRLTGSQYIVECILKPTVDLIPALVGIYMAVTESIFGVLVRLMLLAAGFIVTSLLCIRRTSSSQNI